MSQSFASAVRRRFHILPALLLAACASTPSLIASWRDPALAAPLPGRLLVVGVTQSDAGRRIFEDGFAQALRTAGRDAVASHTLAGESGPISDQRMKQAVATSGATGVFTARLARIDQKVDVVPGAPPPYMGGGFYGWYGPAWSMSQPDVIQYQEATIEATLWDVKTDRVVWTGTTRTTQTDPAKVTEGLAKVLIDKMHADGVI
jgi:hypothetical protein